MHHAILRQATATILGWPLAGHEQMAADAAGTVLIRAESGGILGQATPEQRERISSILTSMSTFVQVMDYEDVVTLGHWRAGGQPHHFMRLPGRSASDSIRAAMEGLWQNVDEAVFQFRWEGHYAKEYLGKALHALQDSFSPTHVKREKKEDGSWVIKDLFEYTAQEKKDHDKGDAQYAVAGEWQLSELGKATVLASELLLSYFVQRVLGLGSQAAQTRQTLETAFLRDEAS